MKPPKVSQAAAGRNLWTEPRKYPRKYPKNHVRQWATNEKNLDLNLNINVIFGGPQFRSL